MIKRFLDTTKGIAELTALFALAAFGAAASR